MRVAGNRIFRRRRGFTLVELLMVVAIIAVIGASVVVYYGKGVPDTAKSELALHEMGLIRDAFIRFHADNFLRMLNGDDGNGMLQPLPGATRLMPTPEFIETFDASVAVPNLPTSTKNPSRAFGEIELFERYGLWPLLQSSIVADSERGFVFTPPTPLSMSGWKGPYISSAAMKKCAVPDSGYAVPTIESTSAAIFPQIKTPFYTESGKTNNPSIYRIVYCEHEEEATDSASHEYVIYRRLLLLCPKVAEKIDSWDEIRAYVGNRRGGGTLHLPIDLQTGASKTYDSEDNVFIMELLNMDIER